MIDLQSLADLIKRSDAYVEEAVSIIEDMQDSNLFKEERYYKKPRELLKQAIEERERLYELERLSRPADRV